MINDEFTGRQDGVNACFFNEETGAKHRFAPKGETYSKSTWPELVDVKMTDRCIYAGVPGDDSSTSCPWCYQASTREGVHGDTGYLKQVVDTLARDGVFEIAYGGGEPVLHPDFIELIAYTRGAGIVPNFTTFGTEWLTRFTEAELQSIAANTGAIGVSVHNVKQIGKYTRIRDRMEPLGCNVLAQHVYGSVDHDATMEMITTIDNILLLGYKTVGFGNRFQPHKFTDAQVTEHLTTAMRAGFQLSVDTAFLDNYAHVLTALNISETLWSSPEGHFSCYIDGVKQEIGPSSYCDKKEMLDLPVPGNYQPIYATF